MVEPCGIYHQPGRDRRVSDPQMGQGVGLPADQGALELYRQPDRRALCLEWHDDNGNWLRSYGNGNWEFDADGLMQHRFASVSDLPPAREQAKIPPAARPLARHTSGPQRIGSLTHHARKKTAGPFMKVGWLFSVPLLKLLIF